MTMIFRMIQLNAIALALLLVTGQAFAADETKEASHKGKVVNITDTALVMTSKGGPEHTHELTAATKLTLDGVACKAEDIKAGSRIRVTTHTTGDKDAVVEVEALHKHHMFANTHDGTFVSLTDKKLVMKDAEGNEHTHAVSADTKMCCGGKECKASALKAGMKIQVTTKRGDKGVVTEIEALDKHTEYDQDVKVTAAAVK
jgi:hypothetical protein